MPGTTLTSGEMTGLWTVTPMMFQYRIEIENGGKCKAASVTGRLGWQLAACRLAGGRHLPCNEHKTLSSWQLRWLAGGLFGRPASRQAGHGQCMDIQPSWMRPQLGLRSWFSNKPTCLQLLTWHHTPTSVAICSLRLPIHLRKTSPYQHLYFEPLTAIARLRLSFKQSLQPNSDLCRATKPKHCWPTLRRQQRHNHTKSRKPRSSTLALVAAQETLPYFGPVLLRL